MYKTTLCLSLNSGTMKSQEKKTRRCPKLICQLRQDDGRTKSYDGNLTFLCEFHNPAVNGKL